jgi:hypothetical protein
MSTQGHIEERTLALLSARRDHQQEQANAASAVAEAIRVEAIKVIKVIQHTTVQTRTRSLSIHSQAEPDDFRSLTTRVRRCLLAHRFVDPYR